MRRTACTSDNLALIGECSWGSGFRVGYIGFDASIDTVPITNQKDKLANEIETGIM